VLQRQTARGSKNYLIKVETHIEGSSIFLYISRETEPWPLKLRNDTNLKFTFQQAVSVPLDGDLFPDRFSRTMRHRRRTVMHGILLPIAQPTIHGTIPPPKTSGYGWLQTMCPCQRHLT